LAGTLSLLVALVVAAWPAPAAAQTIRHVSASDPTCGGPNAVLRDDSSRDHAAQASDTIRVQPGTYIEQLSITSKNSTATSETQRIVIEVAERARRQRPAHAAHGPVTNGHARANSSSRSSSRSEG